jgi:hypothetical protein
MSFVSSIGPIRARYFRGDWHVYFGDNMNIRQDGITSNAARLLWAGFVAILATGVGFGVRGGILANWAPSSASPELS